jgi:hypothetical protein
MVPLRLLSPCLRLHRKGHGINAQLLRRNTHQQMSHRQAYHHQVGQRRIGLKLPILLILQRLDNSQLLLHLHLEYHHIKPPTSHQFNDLPCRQLKASRTRQKEATTRLTIFQRILQ